MGPGDKVSIPRGHLADPLRLRSVGFAVALRRGKYSQRTTRGLN